MIDNPPPPILVLTVPTLLSFDLRIRFYGLTERMSKMEATIGPIVTKLDSILNKIDDAKRIKMKKKETMQRLIENIEDDDQSKLIVFSLFEYHFHDLLNCSGRSTENFSDPRNSVENGVYMNGCSILCTY